jgi:ribosome biogenesis GTPase
MLMVSWLVKGMSSKETKMITGTVFKTLGGYYFVRAQHGEYRCYLRGRFRRKNKVLVGDNVIFEPQDNNTGVIEEVQPRKTRLYRPPVANVNRAIIVFSATQPNPNLFLLDRFLLQGEIAGVEPVICLNKIDLVEKSDIPSLYRWAGYTVIVTSAKTGQGINELDDALKDNISVLAGPSGVGKSSLLNSLQPDLSLETGEISSKLKAGRHTTRHVELLRLKNGGFVADTPGFSNLNIPREIKSTELGHYFPDFEDFSPHCRFSGCLHHREPECAVKQAVDEGKIVGTRYEHYITLLHEVIEQERRH